MQSDLFDRTGVAGLAQWREILAAMGSLSSELPDFAEFPDFTEFRVDDPGLIDPRRWQTPQ